MSINSKATKSSSVVCFAAMERSSYYGHAPRNQLATLAGRRMADCRSVAGSPGLFTSLSFAPFPNRTGEICLQEGLWIPASAAATRIDLQFPVAPRMQLATKGMAKPRSALAPCNPWDRRPSPFSLTVLGNMIAGAPIRGTPTPTCPAPIRGTHHIQVILLFQLCVIGGRRWGSEEEEDRLCKLIG